MSILNTVFVGIGIFLASLLILLIGAIVSVPMSIIGAYLYYVYDKK